MPSRASLQGHERRYAKEEYPEALEQIVAGNQVALRPDGRRATLLTVQESGAAKT